MVIHILLYVSGLPFDGTNHEMEDRQFSRPYNLSTFALTSFVETEIVQFLLFRLHILTATALQWINDRDVQSTPLFILWNYRWLFGFWRLRSNLLLHICAVRQLLTSSFFLIIGSQYRCAKPNLYICFEFSEWCYYVTTFGFQNHILGLWHGDDSWFWHWGHVINMTSSYEMWRWCQYTSEAGYLWTLCNVCWFSRLALCLSVLCTRLCTRVVWCFYIINILHNLQLLQRFSHVLHMYW